MSRCAKCGREARRMMKLFWYPEGRLCASCTPKCHCGKRAIPGTNHCPTHIKAHIAKMQEQDRIREQSQKDAEAWLEFDPSEETRKSRFKLRR